ncbi:MAG: DEAD/DEAH box helicase family protein [Sedimentibacter sp.]|nr:DEAD/DEAH box helicase family protein [Sedimentibacter sp.]
MKKLTEEDIKYRYITPAIEKAGWIKEQVLMEYFFTDGQVLVRGNTVKRGKRKKADYILTHKDGQLPLAIIEAKDAEHSIGAGMQQAMEYAEILHIPFAYSSNGSGFVEHDYFTGAEEELRLDQFPSNKELWSRYIKGKGLDVRQEKIVTEPDYYDVFSQKKLRYYQRIAVGRTLEAIARGQNRILLVMATGTGKTFTAFQIIWKLLKTETVKRVLYLADRNILIDQTMQQDFRPFEKIMTKVQDKSLDSSYEIYMSLYHQLAGDEGNEPFREFKPEFFDLIIVDEFHHAAAKTYRKLIEKVKHSFLLGLTATPYRGDRQDILELCNNNIIVNYEMRTGIDMGILSPYHYFGCFDNVDYSNIKMKGNNYDICDLEKALIIPERDEAIIQKWKEKANEKPTIAFCCSHRHAERMAESFIKHGINAEVYLSDTAKDKRAALISDLQQRDIKLFVQLMC